MNRLSTRARLMLWGCLTTGLCANAGCEVPREAIKYPEQALQVRYESADDHSTCLVASVAMAANYLLDERRFTEKAVVQEMRAGSLDHTLVADMGRYLESKGLHLLTLSGQLGEKPPAGLSYWVRYRGYPVICVINRETSGNRAFNHAVVVIGISAKPEEESTDIIHYFDPSTTRPLHADEAGQFETLWARGEHAMLIVVAPPGEDTGSAGR